MSKATGRIIKTDSIRLEGRVQLSAAAGKTILPKGKPPTPKAISKEKEPVETTSVSTFFTESNFIIAPSPNLSCNESKSLSTSPFFSVSFLIAILID